ncbi:hypothetical protein NKDENANG_01315 [Candidatus Entotheonellaceae bacterium PAL068K]
MGHRMTDGQRFPHDGKPVADLQMLVGACIDGHTIACRQELTGSFTIEQRCQKPHGWHDIPPRDRHGSCRMRRATVRHVDDKAGTDTEQGQQENSLSQAGACTKLHTQIPLHSGFATTGAAVDASVRTTGLRT